MSILIILAFIIIFYFMGKAKLKSNMMAGNQFVQSKQTSDLIDKIQKDEDSAQEKRLLSNKRYVAMRQVLKREQENLKDFRSPYTKKIEFSGYKMVLKVVKRDGHLELRIKPDTLFGFMFSITEVVR